MTTYKTEIDWYNYGEKSGEKSHHISNMEHFIFYNFFQFLINIFLKNNKIQKSTMLK